jgi:hypothetical protein
MWVTANSGAARPALDSTNSLWTPVGSPSTAVANGTTRRSFLYGRIASGDANDTFTYDRSDGACNMGGFMCRFTGTFAGTVADVFDAAIVGGDNGAFSGVDFGLRTPAGGTQDYLCLGGLALASSNQPDPSGYTEVLSSDIDGGFIGFRVEAWTRAVTAASENPPQFGSGADLVTAFFVMVRPAASGGGTVARPPRRGGVQPVLLNYF